MIPLVVMLRVPAYSSVESSEPVGVPANEPSESIVYAPLCHQGPGEPKLFISQVPARSASEYANDVPGLNSRVNRRETTARTLAETYDRCIPLLVFMLLLHPFSVKESRLKTDDIPVDVRGTSVWSLLLSGKSGVSIEITGIFFRKETANHTPNLELPEQYPCQHHKSWTRATSRSIRSKQHSDQL